MPFTSPEQTPFPFWKPSSVQNAGFKYTATRAVSDVPRSNKRRKAQTSAATGRTGRTKGKKDVSANVLWGEYLDSKVSGLLKQQKDFETRLQMLEVENRRLLEITKQLMSVKMVPRDLQGTSTDHFQGHSTAYFQGHSTADCQGHSTADFQGLPFYTTSMHAGAWNPLESYMERT